MKRKFFWAGLLIITLILGYRTLFCNRIIAIENNGGPTYKDRDIMFFGTPPLSIINPFKKQPILDEIKKYCNSGEFDNYYKLYNLERIRHMNYKRYKELLLANEVKISAIREEKGKTYILVAIKDPLSWGNDPYIKLVFIMDKNNNVIGYF
ncbi:MAG: hypothetical protein LBR81_03590 [Prevotellaceae bacterium]|jgi:hypothetical protein|nr:hypothetical protein [Prevotellaceae bacterium]